MRDSSTLLRRLRLVPPILIVLYAVVCIVEMRSLHADGAYAFLHSLLAQGYWIGDQYRVVADLVAQTPLVAAMGLGVDDRSLLAMAHGVGYILIPSLAWAVALILLRKTVAFDFVLLSYCITALNSGFLAVGEFNYLFGFAALAFAFTLRYWEQQRVAFAWLLLATSVLVASSHGMAILLAPLLMAAIALPWRRLGPVRRARLALVGTLVVLALGTMSAALSIVKPYSPGNVIRASNLGSPILENHQLQFTFVWLLLIPLAVLAGSTVVRRVVTGVLVVGLVVLVLDEGLWSTPMQQYDARVWTAIAMTLILLVGLFTWLTGMRPEHRDTATPPAWQGRLTLLAVALFIGLLIPATIQTVQFGSFIRSFQTFVNTHTGQVANADFVAAVPAATRYGWPWTYPTLSLVLGTTAGHALVLNPEATIWRPPFEPDNAPVLPERFAPR